ncbi:MAG: hypothetical protein SGJ16_11340 [Nitrospirota bacterium]|nr:hypothetical protein [Nitrospirota bacterium]
MKTAHICFLWHMHQPYYTDPVAGSASMPWVRLHAVKAYYDMAYGLEKFPSVKATFNFTPSLLRQLQEVGTGTVRDLFLEHAQRPAADLRPEEKAFLVRHFFSANWATMVRPYPRYHELLVKRGADVYGRDLERVAQQFSTQDLLDLQTGTTSPGSATALSVAIRAWMRYARKTGVSRKKRSRRCWPSNSSPCRTSFRSIAD